MQSGFILSSADSSLVWRCYAVFIRRNCEDSLNLWRWYFGTATNHVIGDGWWSWWIPLKGGDVSVGVVFDQRIVDWSGLA